MNSPFPDLIRIFDLFVNGHLAALESGNWRIGSRATRKSIDQFLRTRNLPTPIDLIADYRRWLRDRGASESHHGFQIIERAGQVLMELQGWTRTQLSETPSPVLSQPTFLLTRASSSQLLEEDEMLWPDPVEQERRDLLEFDWDRLAELRLKVGCVIERLRLLNREFHDLHESDHKKSDSVDEDDSLVDVADLAEALGIGRKQVNRILGQGGVPESVGKLKINGKPGNSRRCWRWSVIKPWLIQKQPKKRSRIEAFRNQVV